MNKIIGKLLCKCGIHTYSVTTCQSTLLYRSVYQVENWCSRCGILYCSEYPKECNLHIYSLERRDNNVLQK